MSATLSRRQLLKLSSVGGIGIVLAACTPLSGSTPPLRTDAIPLENGARAVRTGNAVDMKLLNGYSDWATTHTLIIPGNFGGSGYTDLLIYDQDSGNVGFLTTYLGHITSFEPHTGWYQTWDMIIPGNFSSGPYTDLLFYDRTAGVAEIYQTDGQGNLTDGEGGFGPWKHYTMGKTWDLIIPGHFAGVPNPYVWVDRELAAEFLTDLLFYDRAAGVAEFRQFDGQGLVPLAQYTDWRKTWTHIVPHYFGYDQASERNGIFGAYTDLLFYDRQSGDAEFYRTDGFGNITLLRAYPDPQQPGSSGWVANLDVIIPGIFGNNADLLLFDRSSGQMEFQLTYQGWFQPLSVWPTDRTWSHIVPGAFGKSGFTDLLLYDKLSGRAEFYRYEVPTPWPSKALEGYVSASSVIADEQLNFHASGPCGDITIDIYRKGGQDTAVYNAQATVQPEDTPDNAYEAGCDWPVIHSLVIPQDWASGLYVAHLSNAANDTTDIPFIVKTSRTKARILFQMAVATSQAYNWWGGRSLYGHGINGNFVFSSDPRAHKVSFNRPSYLNFEKATKDEYSYYELPLIQWLERNEFQVDYCTSIDLHADPSLLEEYNLLLSVGHDEYWSREMRQNVMDFVAAGGNVAFFSANTCWWQVRFEDQNRTMVCYKNARLDPLTATQPELATVHWYESPVNEAENTLTGVSWRHGSLWQRNFDERPLVPYKVRQASHWVFEGTNLQDGDTFGTETGWTVVGAETDAVGEHTPSNFEILATADFEMLTPEELKGWGNWWGGTPQATMGIFTNGGTVFTAATLDWSRGLSLDGGWNPVDRITWNVLNRLG